MWEAPAWVSTLISGKIQSKIAAANRQNEADIAAANREVNAHIAEMDRATKEAIASMDNETKRYVADLSFESQSLQRDLDRWNATRNRASNESIALQNRLSNERIAEANRESNVLIARERNATQLEVANVTGAYGITNSVIHVIPAILTTGKSNNVKNNRNNNSPTSATPITGPETVTSNTVSDAKKRADALFPELDPTFKIEKHLPTLSKPMVGALGVGAAIAAFGGGYNSNSIKSFGTASAFDANYLRDI